MAVAPPLKRILYVEDETDNQEIARWSLERIGGFELRVASSGAEALRLLDDFTPDLFLLDVMMPVMDGPTLLGELRRRPGSAAIPALFMTAAVGEEDKSRYLGLGAADVITKPFDPMTLPRRLREVWDRIHG